MKSLNMITTAIAIPLTCGIASADITSQLASLQAQVNQLQTQITSSSGNSMSSMVDVDPALSWQMMSNMAGVGKEMNLLQARQAGLNAPLTLGGYAEGDAIYQHTNSTGPNNAAQFNAVPLSNGATLSSTTGQSGANLFLSNADLAATAALNSWTTAYIQLGAKNVGSSSSSNNFQIQDAYIVAGQLTKSPLYGYIGDKDIDFGSFASVNMYNSPMTRDFFEASGNTAGLGLNAYGFNATVSLMNGGSSTNLYTTNNTNFSNNYALNLNYGMNVNNINWNIGAGYLNGSRFLTSNNQTNGAWDLNGKLSIAGFDVLAEYVTTISQSYGATAFAPALSGIPQKVSVWDLGADYNFALWGVNSAISADYGQANLASGSANLLKQLVVGYRIEPVNNVWTGIEYSYNKNGLNAATGNVYGASYSSNTVLWDITAAF